MVLPARSTSWLSLLSCSERSMCWRTSAGSTMRAKGLLATAVVQALVAVVATVAALTGGHGGVEVLRQLVLNGFFVAMWLVSALLFHRAARQDG